MKYPVLLPKGYAAGDKAERASFSDARPTIRIAGYFLPVPLQFQHFPLLLRQFAQSCSFPPR